MAGSLTDMAQHFYLLKQSFLLISVPDEQFALAMLALFSLGLKRCKEASLSFSLASISVSICLYFPLESGSAMPSGREAIWL